MNLYIWKYVQPTVHYTSTPPYYTPDRVIDQYASLIWCERQQEPGEFELYMRATPELLAYFKDPELMITRQDTDCAMIPESVELTTGAEDGNYLRIAGRSAESLLNRRSIIQTGSWTTETGSAEHAIRYYAQENITRYWYDHRAEPGAPTDIFRFLPFLRYDVPQEEFTETIEAQPFGQELGAFISETCRACGYGYRIAAGDRHRRELTLALQVYRGVDRSVNQSAVTPVIFSPDFATLGSTVYRYDRRLYRNTVYAAGEGAGRDRVIAKAASALDMTDPYYYRSMGVTRREKFLDCKNVSSNSAGIDGDADKYFMLLYGTAKAEVEASQEKTDFSGEAAPSGMYVYRRDYWLGDTVTVENSYGITGTATVTEVTEADDASGLRVVPTLSEWRS